MKSICSHADQCNQEACLHRLSHDDCDHTCQRMAGARCVMDMESLPEFKDHGTVAIMIWREKAAWPSSP